MLGHIILDLGHGMPFHLLPPPSPLSDILFYINTSEQMSSMALFTFCVMWPSTRPLSTFHKIECFIKQLSVPLGFELTRGA